MALSSCPEAVSGNLRREKPFSSSSDVESHFCLSLSCSSALDALRHTKPITARKEIHGENRLSASGTLYGDTLAPGDFADLRSFANSFLSRQDTEDYQQ